MVEGVEGGCGGSVKLAWIGANGQPVTSDIAASLGLPRPGGVLLKERLSRRPAGQARA